MVRFSLSTLSAIAISGALTLGALRAVAAAPARADVAPEPCDGKQLGDACTTFDGSAGTCIDNPNAPGTLLCQATTSATAA